MYYHFRLVICCLSLARGGMVFRFRGGAAQQTLPNLSRHRTMLLFVTFSFLMRRCPKALDDPMSTMPCATAARSSVACNIRWRFSVTSQPFLQGRSRAWVWPRIFMFKVQMEKKFGPLFTMLCLGYFRRPVVRMSQVSS